MAHPSEVGHRSGRVAVRWARGVCINNYTQHLASHVFVFCFPLAMLFAHASEFCIDMTYSESS